MCAVPNMAVFCSALTSCFRGTLLTYFLNDLEIIVLIFSTTFVLNISLSKTNLAIYYHKCTVHRS